MRSTRSSSNNRKTRVLVVDASATLRAQLADRLSSDRDLEVVGTAHDPHSARDKLVHLQPDVMVLDSALPGMGGIAFLHKVMAHFPTRTLMLCSGSDGKDRIAREALAAGALSVLAKPSLGGEEAWNRFLHELVLQVRTVANRRIELKSPQVSPQRLPSACAAAAAAKPSDSKPPRPSAVGSMPQLKSRALLPRPIDQLIVIASSTGGTEALKRLLPCLPADIPPILIVQHMTSGFTRAYAEQLDRLCPFEVREAANGDSVLPGRALLAPGDFHMELMRSGATYSVKLDQRPLLHGVRPAADYLMRSAAREARVPLIGIILTGMGRDGAQGLLEMRRRGAFTIAQDEESCVVFGMPKAAIELCAASVVLPLNLIAGRVAGKLRKKAG